MGYYLLRIAKSILFLVFPHLSFWRGHVNRESDLHVGKTNIKERATCVGVGSELREAKREFVIPHSTTMHGGFFEG